MIRAFSFFLWICCAVAEQSPIDRMLDRVVKQERDLLTLLGKHSPVVETYIQVHGPGEAVAANAAPAIEKDVYFLGRMNLTGEVKYEALIEQEEAKRNSRFSFPKISKPKDFVFLPRGFAQMAIVDSQSFDRKTYRFEYVRREFL